MAEDLQTLLEKHEQGILLGKEILSGDEIVKLNALLWG